MKARTQWMGAALVTIAAFAPSWAEGGGHGHGRGGGGVHFGIGIGLPLGPPVYRPYPYYYPYPPPYYYAPYPYPYYYAPPAPVYAAPAPVYVQPAPVGQQYYAYPGSSPAPVPQAPPQQTYQSNVQVASPQPANSSPLPKYPSSTAQPSLPKSEVVPTPTPQPVGSGS